MTFDPKIKAKKVSSQIDSCIEIKGGQTYRRIMFDQIEDFIKQSLQEALASRQPEIDALIDERDNLEDDHLKYIYIAKSESKISQFKKEIDRQHKLSDDSILLNIKQAAVISKMEEKIKELERISKEFIEGIKDCQQIDSWSSVSEWLKWYEDKIK